MTYIHVKPIFRQALMIWLENFEAALPRERKFTEFASESDKIRYRNVMLLIKTKR